MQHRMELEDVGASYFLAREDQLGALVEALMGPQGSEHVSAWLEPAGETPSRRLTLADSETGFLYLEASVSVLPELRLDQLSSRALYPRSDARNEAVVFALRLPEEQREAVGLATFVCEVRAGGVTSTAAAVTTAEELACMLPVSETVSFFEDFDFKLHVTSGLGNLSFPVLFATSPSIPHSSLGDESDSTLRTAGRESVSLSSLLAAEERERQASLQAAEEVLLEEARQLSFEARLVYDSASMWVFARLKRPGASFLPADLLLRLRTEISRRPVQLGLLSEGSAEAWLSQC